MIYATVTLFMLIALAGLFASLGAGWLRLGVSLSVTTGAIAAATVQLSGAAAYYYGVAGLIAVCALEAAVLALLVNAASDQRLHRDVTMAFTAQRSGARQRRASYASTAPDVRQAVADAILFDKDGQVIA